MTVINILSFIFISLIIAAITVKEIQQMMTKRKPAFVYHNSHWYWGDTIKIITNDGKGTIRVSFDKELPCAATIDSFSVVETARNKGIGKQLLEKAEQAAKDYDNNIKYVLLDAEKNSWVVDWYKRCGYEVIKETDNYYTMEKTLNNV